MRLWVSICTVSFAGYAFAQSCGDPQDAVPFLRGTDGIQHYYTTSPTELSSRQTFVREDKNLAWVFKTQVPSSVPLYYLASDVGDHFYTTDAVERDSVLAATAGYEFQGIAAYVYEEAAQCGGIPFYRQYHKARNDHFYTTSADERDMARTKSGYIDENIQAYVVPSPSQASSSASSTSTSPPASSPSSNPATAPTDPKSESTILAIALGASAGVLVLLVASIILWFCRRRTRRENNPTPMNVSYSPVSAVSPSHIEPWVLREESPVEPVRGGKIGRGEEPPPLYSPGPQR